MLNESKPFAPQAFCLPLLEVMATVGPGKRLNKLTGGIGDPRIMTMTDAAHKAAAEAEPMKAIREAYGQRRVG